MMDSVSRTRFCSTGPPIPLVYKNSTNFQDAHRIQSNGKDFTCYSRSAQDNVKRKGAGGQWQSALMDTRIPIVGRLGEEQPGLGGGLVDE